MSYSLVGSTYIGTGTLPTPVPGYEARDTNTGNIYVSNTAGTAWTLIGNANQTNLGLLPLTGGTMTGAIAGASGWAPVDSPNFTAVAKLAGVNLATVNDLSTSRDSVLNQIQPKITEAVASTTAAITVKSKIAIATGILTFTTAATQTIPLPTYPAPDGTTAAESDCKWVAFFIGSDLAGTYQTTWPSGRSDSNGDCGLIWSANPTTTRTFNALVKDKGGNNYVTIVGYIIIGTK